jgi:hypothetical protein
MTEPLRRYPPTTTGPPLPMDGLQVTNWEYEEIPTQCWAIYENGVNCSNFGIGKLGLCERHREDILGHD